MALVARTSADAFEVVYDRHGGAAFSLAYRICGSARSPRTSPRRHSCRSGARGARYDRARGSVRTWVLGIVHNRAIDALRRVGRARPRSASDEGIEERFEAPRAHRLEAARREEAREVRARARDAARRAVARSSSSRTSAASPSRRSPRCSATPIGTVKGRMRLALEKMRDSASGGGSGHERRRSPRLGRRISPHTCSVPSAGSRERRSRLTSPAASAARVTCAGSAPRRRCCRHRLSPTSSPARLRRRLLAAVRAHARAAGGAAPSIFDRWREAMARTLRPGLAYARRRRARRRWRHRLSLRSVGWGR